MQKMRTKEGESLRVISTLIRILSLRSCSSPLFGRDFPCRKSSLEEIERIELNEMAMPLLSKRIGPQSIACQVEVDVPELPSACLLPARACERNLLRAGNASAYVLCRRR